MDLTRNLALVDTETSDEEFVSLCENMWTNKIVNLFHNLSNPDKTRYLQSERLKKILAEYNESHDFDDPLEENQGRARKAELPATSLIFFPLLNIKAMLIVT